MTAAPHPTDRVFPASQPATLPRTTTCMCGSHGAQRVSEVWTLATGAGPSILVNRPTERRGASRIPVSPFAARFRPPTKSTVGVARFRYGTISVAVGLVWLLVMSGGFISPGSSTGHTVHKPESLVFTLFMVSCALIGGMEMMRVKRSCSETAESRERMRRETLAWHAAMRQWAHTYYCSKCGSVFVAESNDVHETARTF